MNYCLEKLPGVGTAWADYEYAVPDVIGPRPSCALFDKESFAVRAVMVVKAPWACRLGDGDAAKQQLISKWKPPDSATSTN